MGAIEWPKLCLLLLVTIAAGTDIQSLRIPNWLTAAGVLAGLVLNGLPRGLLGFSLGFGVYLMLYLLNAVGAGDVKLMGGVGALAGWSGCLEVLVLTALLGGAWALAVRIWPRMGPTNGRAVPHGAVIAAAVLLVLLVFQRLGGFGFSPGI